MRSSPTRLPTLAQVADRAFLEFAFPPRYRYDVLRALDETLPFAFPERPGTPSAWITLRALRVLTDHEHPSGERAFERHHVAAATDAGAHERPNYEA